jgi:hypothetical protein
LQSNARAILETANRRFHSKPYFGQEGKHRIKALILISLQEKREKEVDKRNVLLTVKKSSAYYYYLRAGRCLNRRGPSTPRGATCFGSRQRTFIPVLRLLKSGHSRIVSEILGKAAVAPKKASAVEKLLPGSGRPSPLFGRRRVPLQE